MTFAHGKCALSCIYDCFIRIYSICIILLCIIYLNYSKWDFAIQLCLHKTMRKFRVQLYLLILAFSSQLEKVVKLEIFFEFLQNSWAVICTCARQTEQPSNLITMAKIRFVVQGQKDTLNSAIFDEITLLHNMNLRWIWFLDEVL